MARPPRIDRVDGLYHVTARGNGRARVFFSDADRERFLGQLADNLETYGCVLHAYVLMDNHFHLLVRTPQANLSRFMQRLMTSYAMYARYKHKRPGHQFQGRFKAKLVESDRYLRQVSRYIHLNPVRLKACARWPRARRLKHLGGYRWSSYRGYVGDAAPEDFVSRRAILRQFAPGIDAARAEYRRYVEACVARTDEQTVEMMGGNPYAIGSPEFGGRIGEELSGRRSGGEKDKDVNLPRRRVTLEAVDARVAAHYGIGVAQLKRHGRATGEAKAVAVELACRLTGERQRAVGQWYGAIGSSGVAKIRARLRAEEAQRLRETIGRIAQEFI